MVWLVQDFSGHLGQDQVGIIFLHSCNKLLNHARSLKVLFNSCCYCWVEMEKTMLHSLLCDLSILFCLYTDRHCGTCPLPDRHGFWVSKHTLKKSKKFSKITYHYDLEKFQESQHNDAYVDNEHMRFNRRLIISSKSLYGWTGNWISLKNIQLNTQTSNNF